MHSISSPILSKINTRGRGLSNIIISCQTKQQQKGVRRTVRAMDLNSEKFDLGNPTLNELWNICPDNLAACQDSNRNFTPDVGVSVGTIATCSCFEIGLSRATSISHIYCQRHQVFMVEMI